MTLVLSSLPPMQLTCPLLLQISTFFEALPALKAMVGRIEARCIDQEPDAPAGQSCWPASCRMRRALPCPSATTRCTLGQPEAMNALILTFLRTKVCHTRV